MRRIIGQTGAPQIIPPISTSLQPLLDFTSEASQRLLDSRTIYVDLWAYFAFDNAALANYNGNAYPAFWQAMTGEAPANALQSCLFASDTPDIQAAVASSKHRVVNDLLAIPHQTQNLNMPLDSILDALGPTKVLSRYPIAGGTALWFVHNYANLIQADRQVYVWGYYSFDGDDKDNANLVRPLQPDIDTPMVPYMPVNCGSDGVAVDVHEVSSEFQDEVTLDVKVVGYNSAVASTEEMTAEFNGYMQPPAGTVYDPAITLLRFQNGTLPGGVVVPSVTMPIWSGGEEDNPAPGDLSQSKRKFPWWKCWLDGIPMRGAGKIQIMRSSYAALMQRSCARGTFVRY